MAPFLNCSPPRYPLFLTMTLRQELPHALFLIKAVPFIQTHWSIRLFKPAPQPGAERCCLYTKAGTGISSPLLSEGYPGSITGALGRGGPLSSQLVHASMDLLAYE